MPGNITREMTSIRLAPGLKLKRNLVPKIDLTRSVLDFFSKAGIAGTKVANKIAFGDSLVPALVFSFSFSVSCFFLLEFLLK